MNACVGVLFGFKNIVKLEFTHHHSFIKLLVARLRLACLVDSGFIVCLFLLSRSSTTSDLTVDNDHRNDLEAFFGRSASVCECLNLKLIFRIKIAH